LVFVDNALEAAFDPAADGVWVPGVAEAGELELEAAVDPADNGAWVPGAVVRGELEVADIKGADSPARVAFAFPSFAFPDGPAVDCTVQTAVEAFEASASISA
jgi:hypothetical protein